MIKKLSRKAKMTISPPDVEGNSVVHVFAESKQTIELDFGLSYDSAMRLLCDMLYDHQVAIASKRLYKH